MWNRRPNDARDALEALECRLLMASHHTRTPFAQQTNLISDQAGHAQVTDANVVNGWGIAAGGQAPFWISDNGTGTSEVVKITGGVLSTGGGGPQTITIPAGTANADGANPTGAVFNNLNSFSVTDNGSTGPAAYLFAGEDGTISAWRVPGNLAAISPAVKVVDNSASGAVYKGIAIAKEDGSARNLIYVANFHSGTVDVFNDTFQPVTLPRTHKINAFTDASIPAGYAPFNVAAIDGKIYVSYAKQDDTKHDDVAGPRHGFVDVFNTDGALLQHFAAKGSLDSPWAIVKAPATFGQFGGDILIGNFGNGQISAFNSKGQFQGLLTDSSGATLSIDGLWGLSFGTGVNAGNTGTLYFTAGPAGESHGLFGAIDMVLRAH